MPVPYGNNKNIMKKRLETILAHAGISSRRHAASIIKGGAVKVDGRVVTEKGLRFDPEENVITVSGKALPAEEKKYYFLFNKPKNVISTVIDTHGRRKVTDYFVKEKNARLYPVGRLDKDTTGVLLVTNDGELAMRLMHPRYVIDKEYTATVEKRLTEEDATKIKNGITLGDGKTSPCELNFVSKNPEGVIYRLKLHEGRKRQIRRMFYAVGVKVLELNRNKYAGFTAGNLKEGEYRKLSESEVQRLRELTGAKNTV